MLSLKAICDKIWDFLKKGLFNGTQIKNKGQFNYLCVLWGGELAIY